MKITVVCGNGLGTSFDDGNQHQKYPERISRQC